MQQLYLTRRNLLALLSKLDRHKAGEKTLRTILKHDTTHPEYPCSDAIFITAVEDEDYYKGRTAGEMHPDDEARIKEYKKCAPMRVAE